MGKLVAIEGPDHVGKTTLVQHLGFALKERGFSVQTFRFPPDERSREVDHLYDVFTKDVDPMAQQLALCALFNAYTPKILEALRENRLVLVDRYILSPLVACKALELDTAKINEALRSAIVPPDLTVVYTGEPWDVPRESTEHRGNFERRVNELFESDIEEYKHTTVHVTNEAVKAGKADMFLEHLTDEVLGRLRLPLRDQPAANNA